MAADAKGVLLAETWDETVDPTGWWMSEKLDGVRAYWSGSTFYSRNGNVFHAPPFFTKDLPKTPLDGELWLGRGLFQKLVSIVKKKKMTADQEKDWEYVTYLVFDAPKHGGVYEDRVKWLKDNINVSKNTTYAVVVGVKKCEGKVRLNQTLAEVQRGGGEGVMLRKPKSLYEWKRSTTLLKVKGFFDEEALVMYSQPGTGRCAGMMGSIHCQLVNGKEFDIGTGFNDDQRKNPPKKGAVVTFKYQELSNSGHPRFPVYLRTRNDVSWDDVLENAKTHTPNSSVAKVIPQLKKQHTILFSVVPSRDTSGNKIVTSDDEASDAEDEPKIATTSSASAVAKQVCKYGATCYRTNAEHLKKFSHPPKPEEEEAAPAVQPPVAKKGASSLKPPSSPTKGPTAPTASAPAKAKVPCRFGKACFRKSPFHTNIYSHDAADDEESSHADDEDLANLKGEQIVDDEAGDADDEFDMAKFDKGAKLPAHKRKVADEDAMETDEVPAARPSITVSKKDWDKLVERVEHSEGRLSELETLVRELYRKRKATDSVDESDPKRRKV